jgi:predicted transcriptional regulator
MERSHAFETVLALILIGLIGLLFFMVVFAPQPAKGWEMQGNGSVDYMFTGSDDTLCVFQGNNVTAIYKNGEIAWSIQVSDEWNVLNWDERGYHIPVVDEADGTLYLFLSGTIRNMTVVSDFNGNTYALSVNSELMAISPDGKISWEYPFIANAVALFYTGRVGYADRIDSYMLPWIAEVRAVNGRVLLAHDDREEVLSSDGRRLFVIGNITNPVVVDENGHLYAARATGVDAYDRDGKLLWSADIGENITGTYDDRSSYPPVYRALPQYANGTLYVPVDNGTAAIGTDGTVKWVRHLTRGSYTPFATLPIDKYGNTYMMIANQPGGYTYVVMISHDGTENTDVWSYSSDTTSFGGWSTGPVARNDGTIYVVTNNTVFPFQGVNLSESDRLMTINTLTAYDIGSNKALWNFAVPYDDVRRVVLNESNIDEAIVWNKGDITTMNVGSGYYDEQSADSDYLVPLQFHRITINPGKNIVYLSYYSIIYEYPVIFNRSRAIYVNSLYALDNNGTVIWKKPIDEWVSHAVARNDTFYYSTDGGRIGGNTVNVAAGIALIAAAYVFLRFFILGTVARARTRIESNRNRNDLLKFVDENPGVTAVDISRGLKMNLGTTRYHLFILAANHKIASYKDDGKFLRYFRNSGAYSPQERSWLSLMRREPIRKVIAALERNPGLSLQELARELDMSPTAVHNHISELSARGIVDRAQGEEKGFAYTIKEEYRPYIVKTMERL